MRAYTSSPVLSLSFVLVLKQNFPGSGVNGSHVINVLQVTFIQPLPFLTLSKGGIFYGTRFWIGESQGFTARY